MSKNVIRRKSLEPRSPSEAEPDARDGGVQSVDRALSILETLAEDDEGYRLSDLAVRTGLSASTVHRLLATLESRRFVQFDRAESKWHVGVRSFTVGASFARRRNFTAQAIPYLRKLRDLTRETANLAVVDDEFIIVLTRMESREIMRSLTKVGGRVPMVTSGVGKAVLATYSDEDVGAVIRHHGMPRLTEKIDRAAERSVQGTRDDPEAGFCGGRRGGRDGTALRRRRGLQCACGAAGRDLGVRPDQPRHRRPAAGDRPRGARGRGGADGGARRRDAGGETGLSRICGPLERNQLWRQEPRHRYIHPHCRVLLGNVMPSELRSPRLAVLIDADNASAKIADGLFEEIAKIGEASVRRIYGDFSNARSRGWADILSKHAIIPQQQFAYTTGKNASDITLVIDAMDLLHSGRFDGFCLVSSDSDFTRLAARIREQGVDVFGFGEQKTPESFRQACRRFVYTENLLAGTANSQGAASRPTPLQPPDAARPSSRRSSPRWRAKTAGSLSERSGGSSPIWLPISIRGPLVSAI